MSFLIPEIIQGTIAIGDAILSNNKGTTGTVQDVSSKVRRALDTPDRDVPHAMFEAVVKKIGAFMKTNFADPLIAASNESGRALFSVASELNHSLKTFEWAVRFIFSRLDAYRKYGVLDAADIPYASLQPTFAEIKDKLFKSLEARMNEMRDGDALSRESIRSVVALIRSINNQIDKVERVSTAEDKFVKMYCNSVKEYYKGKSEEMLSKNADNLVAYAQWAGRRINEEQELLKELGMAIRWEGLKEALHQSLVRDGFVEIVRDPEGGLAKELDHGNDVSDLYALLELVHSTAKPEEGVIQVAETYKEFGLRRSKMILAKPAPAPEPAPAGQKPKPQRDPIIANFDEFMKFCKHHLQVVWPQQLKSNSKVENSFLAGIGEGIKGEDKVARLLTAYIHNYFINLKEDELSPEVVADITTFKDIFNTLKSKDEFLEDYKGKLASRLLKSNFRRNVESRMITEFKLLVGNSDVHKFNMMIGDLDASDNLTKTFSDANANLLTDLKLKTAFTLCTRQYWPTQDQRQITLPPPIQNIFGEFDRMYRGKYPSRKIEWAPMMCNATLNVLFKLGPKELTGTLAQAIVFMAFDGTFGVSVVSVAQQTGMDEKLTMDIVASFFMVPGFNTLVLVDPNTMQPFPPGSKPLYKTDSLLTINQGFKNANRKLPLPPVKATVKTGAKEEEEKVASLDYSRNNRTQIAIFRYMKSRGTAKFTDMQDDVIRDLKMYFDAQPARVKAQLEDLIDKGFVMRDENDRTKLIYIS